MTTRILTNDLITALRRCTRNETDAEQLEALATVVGTFHDVSTARHERRQLERLLNGVHNRMDATGAAS